MNRKQLVSTALVAIFLVLLVIVAGWAWPPRDALPAAANADTGFDAPDRSLVARLFRKPDATSVPVFVSGLENLPTSLQGTEVDGGLTVDATGHLKIDNGVRRTFDYFLTLIGEEPVDTVIARLRAFIHHQLPAKAAAEAEKMLADYLAYKRALADVQTSVQSADGKVDIDAVRMQMQQVRDLRTQYLSPEQSVAFYTDDDAFDRYSLDRIEILQHNELPPAERATRLAALEAALPTELRESTQDIARFQNLQALTGEVMAHKGGAAELRQVRENLVGAAAADRLETLDTERAAWDNRMHDWLQERAQVLAARGLTEQDRQEQVVALRTQRFAIDETTRVEALERIADGEAQSARWP